MFCNHPASIDRCLPAKMRVLSGGRFLIEAHFFWSLHHKRMRTVLQQLLLLYSVGPARAVPAPPPTEAVDVLLYTLATPPPPPPPPALRPPPLPEPLAIDVLLDGLARSECCLPCGHKYSPATTPCRPIDVRVNTDEALSGAASRAFATHDHEPQVPDGV